MIQSTITKYFFFSCELCLVKLKVANYLQTVSWLFSSHTPGLSPHTDTSMGENYPTLAALPVITRLTKKRKTPCQFLGPF